MSMLLTRSPLEVIGMNGAQQQPKRRSARLSADGAEGENEPPRRNGVQTTSISTKEGDGGEPVVGAAKKKRKGKDSRGGRVEHVHVAWPGTGDYL